MRAARVPSSLAAIAVLLLTGGAAVTCLAQTTPEAGERADETHVLTNADVVQMLKSGFSDSAVIAVIQKSRTQFDLSSASLAELRYAGVPDSVIVAMLESGNRATAAPAPASPAEVAPAPAAAPSPAPPAPEPVRVVAPEPEAPPGVRPIGSGDQGRTRARRGAIVGLSLGGHYAWVIDTSGWPPTEDRLGASLRLAAGGHLGRRVALLAELHASLWPETDDYEAAALFSLGPAVRVFLVPHLFLQGGASAALVAQNDSYGDVMTWLGPAGHLGVGVELTNGHGRFALEFLARLDVAYLYWCLVDAPHRGTGPETTLGTVTGQLAFTWY